MNTIAIIPARAGSKGLPGKNMLRLGGKTLIELAIDCARQSELCKAIVVTSDGEEIREEAARCGARVKTPRMVDFERMFPSFRSNLLGESGTRSFAAKQSTICLTP